MNILHLIDSIDPSQGGPPQVCANLMKQQAEFHSVSLASYSPENVLRKMIPDQNIKSLFLGKSDFVERLLGYRSAESLKKAVQHSDLLHIHNVWETLLISGSNKARKFNKPYVVTPHGMLDPWSMNQKRRKKKFALLLGRRKMLEHAKFIHVLNSEEEFGIRQLGIVNRCEIVPNGVMLAEIDPFLNQQLAIDTFPQIADRPFVLFMARLHYKKGLDILASAAQKFFRICPDWQLIVAGPDGGMAEPFLKQIHEYGLRDRIQMLGPVYGDLKISLLAASKIFCLPSRQEGFSVAVLEAMAAGKPVVISEQCHFSEVASSESGFVDKLDPIAIARSLQKLAESESLRLSMGSAGRSLVEKKYTWSAVGGRLLEAYNS